MARGRFAGRRSRARRRPVIELARLPISRLARTPRSWFVLGVWWVLGLWVAFVARGQGSAHGADRALLDAYAVLVLPVLSYVAVGATLGARSMGTAVAPLVAFGASPWRAAAAAIAVAALTSACLTGGLAAVIAAVAHGAADAPRLKDAIASAYAGGLGGVAYACWFALGASLGRRGGGRTLLLFVDWAAGESEGATAVLSPRGHVRNLLGGSPPLGLTERTSAFWLVVIAAVCAAGAARLARTRT